MTQPEIHVYPDETALIRATADLIVQVAEEAIAQKGRFAIALSGGSTPKPLYRLLASPEYAPKIDWSKVHVFWGDDRTAPPDHPDSNYLMATQTLLDHVPLSDDQIHRIHTELEPVSAAVDYEQQLKAFYGLLSLPRIDLNLLGLGSDGHTASLFPGTPAIDEGFKWVVAQHVEKLDTWRITLTPPVINNSAVIVFLVAGENKAEAVQQVIRGARDPYTYPAQIVDPAEGRLIWMLDEAAAGQVDR